mmetsp:Transcript_10450/g.31939  ORF Transcript_10450/g.31939 Transcript_10450/m.31939 type:complete len:222 (+) Transcript_10450:448-1113(+)
MLRLRHEFELCHPVEKPVDLSEVLHSQRYAHRPRDDLLGGGESVLLHHIERILQVQVDAELFLCLQKLVEKLHVKGDLLQLHAAKDELEAGGVPSLGQGEELTRVCICCQPEAALGPPREDLHAPAERPEELVYPQGQPEDLQEFWRVLWHADLQQREVARCCLSVPVIHGCLHKLPKDDRLHANALLNECSVQRCCLVEASSGQQGHQGVVNGAAAAQTT